MIFPMYLTTIVMTMISPDHGLRCPVIEVDDMVKQAVGYLFFFACLFLGLGVGFS